MGLNLNLKSTQNVLTKTEGYWLYNDKGERFLDLTSGGYAFPLGFGNKEIAAAIHESLVTVTRCHSKLGYTMPIIEEMGDFLCESGGWASHCWTVTGTSAVECAVYMADSWWDRTGDGRRGILSFGYGWNGMSNLTKKMSGMYPVDGTRVHIVDTPIWRLHEEQEEEELITLSEVARKVEQNKDIGSIIINPAPWFYGVNIWSHNFWRQLRKICDDHNILMILDDIASCWGKAKAWHSQDTILPTDVRADISCLGKAITAGYAPLAAAVANERITEVVKDGFGYGHTFQPLVSGIAAMKATTNIIKRDNLLEYSQVIEDRLSNLFQEFVDNGDGSSYRVHGLLGILDLKTTPNRSEANVGDRHYGVSGEKQVNPNIRVCAPLIADDEYFFELKKLMQGMIK